MTGIWWRLTIRSERHSADELAAAIVGATGNGVEELTGGLVRTTLDSEPDARALLQDLTDRFGDCDATVDPAPAVDWATRWRDGVETRRFGRLVLTPSWLPVAAADGEAVISIDPESAFGSGEHGSTRGALTLLERHLRPADRVLDLGSGSGILAIAAAKLGARSAIGIEVDEEALPIAEANAARNHVDDRVRFLCGDAADLSEIAGPADVICANILRSVNTLLMPSLLAALTPTGVVIFAGMEEPEEPLFLPVLAAHGLGVLGGVRDAGWWSVAAQRA